MLTTMQTIFGDPRAKNEPGRFRCVINGDQIFTVNQINTAISQSREKIVNYDFILNKILTGRGRRSMSRSGARTPSSPLLKAVASLLLLLPPLLLVVLLLLLLRLRLRLLKNIKLQNVKLNLIKSIIRNSCKIKK